MENELEPRSLEDDASVIERAKKYLATGEGDLAELGEEICARDLESEVLPIDATFAAERGIWRLWFGAVGTTKVLACGSLDDALESAAATLEPGHFSPPDYEDAAATLGLKWPCCEGDDLDQVTSLAECDHTYTESGYLLSWEWGLAQVTGVERDRIIALANACK